MRNDNTIITPQDFNCFDTFSLNLAYALPCLLLRIQFGTFKSQPNMDKKLSQIINSVQISKDGFADKSNMMSFIEKTCFSLIECDCQNNQLNEKMNNCFYEIISKDSNISKNNAIRYSQNICKRLIEIRNLRKRESVIPVQLNYENLKKESLDSSAYQLANITNSKMVDILNKYYSTLVNLLNKENEFDKKILPYSAKAISVIKNKNNESNKGLSPYHFLSSFVYISGYCTFSQKKLYSTNVILKAVQGEPRNG